MMPLTFKTWVVAIMIASARIVCAQPNCFPFDGEHDYAKAFHDAQQSDKDILVLVGAPWCGPCQKMRNETLLEMKFNCDLEGVEYAHVDCDKESATARKLMDGTAIPQLVRFHKVNGVWQRTRLIGRKSKKEIQEFIK
jgi:thiol-disulfide isomerase/thioredoxin